MLIMGAIPVGALSFGVCREMPHSLAGVDYDVKAAEVGCC